MNEPDNFLSRWSRRKLEAEQEPKPSARPRDPPAHKASAGGAQSAEALAKAESGDPVPSSETEPHTKTVESEALDSRLRGNERAGGPGEAGKEGPTFDITKLPSIESITAETDVRVFLQKGVPAELTRAALRRAWIADPNIRDFIEMAENQWDFATGSDLPGFGSLDASADDIRRMVAEVFGDGPKLAAEADAGAPARAQSPTTTASQTATAEDATGQVPEQEIAGADQGQPPAEGAPAEPAEVVVQRDEVNIAMQQSTPEPEYKSVPTRRPHGRALPQ